jgi:hypothetical protein
VALERLLADAIGDQGNMKKRNRKRGYVKEKRKKWENVGKIESERETYIQKGEHIGKNCARDANIGT